MEPQFAIWGVYMLKKQSTNTYIFFGILLILVCISFVFTNISYDAEYQMAMAYRMIKGDAMIIEMWEPHQTSAFLCAGLMKIYMLITGTTTGVVLFIQLAGLLIRGALCVCLFKTLKEFTGEVPALIGAGIYFLNSPKDLLTPEFGNMQLWFATLMFLSLVQYFKKEKVYQLVLSAIWLCLGVLSYPSFIVAYLAAVVLLWKYSGKKAKDIAVFTGVCAVIGGVFAGYLLWNLGLETIITCISSALALEPSHTVSMSGKLLGHVLNLAEIFWVLLLCIVVGYFIEYVCSLRKGAPIKLALNKEISKTRVAFYAWCVLQTLFLLNILSVENRCWYGYTFLFIIILGFLKRNLLLEAEKRTYIIAMWIGAMNLISTLVLSDHEFLQATPYMLLAVTVSALPLYRWYEQIKEDISVKKWFTIGIHVYLLLLVFRALFIHIPMYGRGQICSVLDDMALIRSGPAIGIITDEDGATRQRDSMKEWENYIEEGDTIWLLGEPVDTLGYLYKDVEVGAPSVMSTPTYNENLLYYWECNPEKYPDVVILASGFGSLYWELLRNEWLMNWLEEEYQAEMIIDGNYWRYYFKEAR